MMLTLLALGGMAAMAADRAETIQRKLTDNDYEGARKKCEKWEASSREVEGSLREACAKAYWPLAAATDSVAEVLPQSERAAVVARQQGRRR